MSFLPNETTNPLLASRSLKLRGETITRAHLRDAVQKALPQISRADASRLVAEVFEEICLSLLRGEEVRLHSFGAFKILEKRARLGRNPRTLEEAIIPPRRVITFYASPILKARVNGETADADLDE